MGAGAGLRGRLDKNFIDGEEIRGGEVSIFNEPSHTRVSGGKENKLYGNGLGKPAESVFVAGSSNTRS